ncbi:MAG: archaeosortase/exosortase family protein [Candidatus Woesearchaeota archaeon]
MNLKNLFGNKNFRLFVFKILLFIFLGIGINIFINVFFKYTYLFRTYLSIPQDFYLEAPNIRTIVLNALLFGVVAFIIRYYKKLLSIKYFKFQKHQWIFIFLSMFFLLGQYLFKYIVNRNTDFFLQAPVFWGIVKILINVLFVISLYFAIFGIPFTKYMFKTFRKEIFFFLLLSVAFFFLMLLVQNLWTYFSAAISKILFLIFSLFFDNVTYKPFVASFTMAEGGGPLLGINNFRAIVGKPCSGIDSFLLFTSLYALIFILDYKKLKKGLAVLFFFIGAIGMFLTNALRILLLFIIGAYYDPKFAVGMFHTNAGWVLFIIYFFIYWWIVSRFIYKK